MWACTWRARRRRWNGAGRLLLHLVVAPPFSLQKSPVQGRPLQGMPLQGRLARARWRQGRTKATWWAIPTKRTKRPPLKPLRRTRSGGSLRRGVTQNGIPGTAGATYSCGMPFEGSRSRRCDGVRLTSAGPVTTLSDFFVPRKPAVQGRSLQGSLSGSAYPIPRREGQDRSRVNASALAAPDLARPSRPNRRQFGNSKSARPKKRPPKSRTLNPAVWPVLGQATRHLPCNARAKLPWGGLPPRSVAG